MCSKNGLRRSAPISVVSATLLVFLLLASPALAAGPRSEEADPLQGTLALQEASGGNIYVANADGSGLRLVSRGMDPQFSPDGTELAFARWDKDKGIYVLDLESGEERMVVAREHPRWPAWSPDGRRLAFGDSYFKRRPAIAFNVPGGPWSVVIGIPGEVGYWSLHVLDLQDGSLFDAPDDWRSYAPSWGPDGEALVYAGVGGLKVLEGEEQRALTDDYWDASPAWSPDGSRIAYMYRQHDHWEIYTIRPDGSAWTRLTKNPLFAERYPNNVAPAWSPDGQHIAFLTDRNGDWELFVMGADGENERPFFEEGLDGIAFQYDFASERVVSWTE